jgi:L-fucose mutarotase
MLIGIPNILSPELLKILMEMGHGDEIVLADGNFPAASNAKRLIRCDGHNLPDLLDAILQLFPLDTRVKQPVSLMGVDQDDDYIPEIRKDYKRIVNKSDSHITDFEIVERFEFYERAKKAYAIVATSEMAKYANIILKKGVI